MLDPCGEEPTVCLYWLKGHKPVRVLAPEHCGARLRRDTI